MSDAAVDSLARTCAQQRIWSRPPTGLTRLGRVTSPPAVRALDVTQLGLDAVEVAVDQPRPRDKTLRTSLPEPGHRAAR
jgi:hypothetical protein